MSIPWIKISTQFFNDEKIRLIESMPEGDSIIVIWTKLLIQAGKCNAGGFVYLTESVPYSLEMLSTVFNRPLPIVRLAFKTFSDLGMINIDESGRIDLLNWNKYQNVEGLEKIRESNRNRVAKFRENRKLVTLHVTDGNNGNNYGNGKEGNPVEIPISKNSNSSKMEGNYNNVTLHVTPCNALDKDIDKDKEDNNNNNGTGFIKAKDIKTTDDLIHYLFIHFLNRYPNIAEIDLTKREVDGLEFEAAKKILEESFRIVGASDSQKQNGRYLAGVIRGKKIDQVKESEKLKKKKELVEAAFDRKDKELKERERIKNETADAIKGAKEFLSEFEDRLSAKDKVDLMKAIEGGQYLSLLYLITKIKNKLGIEVNEEV